MKKGLLLLLLPLPLWGAEKRLIYRGETIAIEIATAPGFGTVITLPEVPEKVGTGDNTSFHVEVYGDTLMVKPKTPVIGAKTNLFALLSGDTVVTFKVRSTEPTQGMDVVSLGWANAKNLQEAKSSPQRYQRDQTVQDLLERMEFRRTGWSGRSEEISIRLKGIATLGQKTFLKFEIRNRGKRTFEIGSVSIFLQKMGGFSGGRVQEEAVIDSEVTFSNRLVEPKGAVSGVIGFSTIEPKRNERLFLKFFEAGERGRVVTVRSPGGS